MKPRIFVGSSTQSLSIGYAIQENLDYDAEVTVWTQDIFKQSGVPLITLINQLETFDFGIFVFGADDIKIIQDKTQKTVRDNVLFETGLFMGKLGKDRVFFVVPDDANDLHIATDLLGITPGRFNPGRSDGKLVAALGPFCNQVRRQISGYINPNILAQELNKKVTHIFGNDVFGNFRVIFPQLTLNASYDSNGNYNQFPFLTADKENNVRVEAPVPMIEVQGTADIATTINKISGHLPKVVSDEETKYELDISYCSLGGATVKTKQLMGSNDNTFYKFAHDPQDAFVIDIEDQSVIFRPNEKYDYAIILKINPSRFKNRVQICVAGVGEWGTSGGCWYFANRWNELEEKFREKEFGAIIRVEKNYRQSGELISCKFRG